MRHIFRSPRHHPHAGVMQVFRGIDCKIDRALYEPGSVITWQQFTSTSKKQLIARRFVMLLAVRIVCACTCALRWRRWWLLVGGGGGGSFTEPHAEW